ncbi:PilZ domain-containing protein [Sphingopyxis witflariensis]|uniref:Pilus assembly protein PilZ n=1 Tax=Sphingopyxis witflariensis TaxID=173675 RepID=A0A246K701_9SPHN|nr:PilZ domain-containing protein [Sphingopyxis witflariensis]OWR01114.1 pilus assembly protein PilZ [Sphingopyxis witflariensis]
MNNPHLSGAADEPAAGDESDRRGADRYRTVWRIAKVKRDGDFGLWRVRNISDRGMMLAADVPIAVGERLEVALSDTVVIRGRVVWSEEGRCGVAFDEEVDVASVLKQLAAEQRAGDFRQPRLPVRTQAQAVTDEGASQIELVDLSQNGAGFVHDGHWEVGKEFELVLAGDIRRKAIVRWSRGGRGGLWLTQPLERSDLESISRFQS